MLLLSLLYEVLDFDVGEDRLQCKVAMLMDKVKVVRRSEEGVTET